MSEMKKYRFINDYKCKAGILPKNSEVLIVNGIVYFNGGILSPEYAKMIIKIIENDVNGEYVKRLSLVKDKF